MEVFKIFLSNLVTFTGALGVAIFYTGTTLATGSILLGKKEFFHQPLALAIIFSVGAATLGLVYTWLSFLGWATPWAVGGVAVAPLVILFKLKWAEILRMQTAFLQMKISFRFSLWQGFFWIAIGLGVFYTLVLTLAWPRGGDQCIYHLVIPRSVLWDHRLQFNPFSHDAGMFYGWQIYALPAFFFGGVQGFQLMTFAALIILSFAIYQFLREKQGHEIGLAGTAALWLVIVGMCRESVVNNDVPLVLVELSMLSLSLAWPTTLRTSLYLGLVGGFLFTIKLTVISSLPLIYFIFLWRARAQFFSVGILLAVSGIAAPLVWSYHNYIASGTPLPHFLLLWPPRSGILPQMAECLPYLLKYFGIWYQKNWNLLFIHGMEIVSLLFVFSFIGIFIPHIRREKWIMYAISYAFARFLAIILVGGLSSVIIFHNRYHLTSYIILGLTGVLVIAWFTCKIISPNWQKLFLVISCLLLFRWWHTPQPALNPAGPHQPDHHEIWPSLGESAVEAVNTFLEPGGGGKSGIGFDWANQYLPASAIVATTAIDPYLMERPFLQILPVCQNLIDLRLSPEELRQALIKYGATHLNITEYTGLNLWISPIIDSWLVSLRKVADLPNVRTLVEFNYANGKGRQSYLELNAVEKNNIQPAIELQEISLKKEPFNTWSIHWRPVEGNKVEVYWNQAPNQSMLLGQVLSRFGSFPIRVEMPPEFQLEVHYWKPQGPLQKIVLEVPPKN